MKRKVSNRDYAFLQRTMTESLRHDSGGTYQMVAAWGKGSHVILGKNKLSKLASSEWDGYPEPLGVHAELDLYLKMGRKMKGGTIYIAGNKRPSRKPLPNTAPCIYCMELIMTTQTKWIVYFKEGIPTKSHISDLH